MSPSGYVVVPTPNGGSCLHVSLQVDPKVKGGGGGGHEVPPGSADQGAPAAAAHSRMSLCAWPEFQSIELCSISWKVVDAVCHCSMCDSVCSWERMDSHTYMQCKLPPPGQSMHTPHPKCTAAVGLVLTHCLPTLSPPLTPTPTPGPPHLTPNPNTGPPPTSRLPSQQGWIPSSVVNLSLEAIPLNIQRIRNTLQQLPPPLLASLPTLNQAQSLGALPLQRRASEDGGTSSTSGTGGYRKAGAKAAAGGGGSGGRWGGSGMSRVEEWLLSSSRQEGGAAAKAAAGSTAAGGVVHRELEGEGEEADAAAVIHSMADGSGLSWGSSKAAQQQAPAGLRRRVRATQ